MALWNCVTVLLLIPKSTGVVLLALSSSLIEGLRKLSPLEDRKKDVMIEFNLENRFVMVFSKTFSHPLFFGGCFFPLTFFLNSFSFKWRRRLFVKSICLPDDKQMLTLTVFIILLIIYAVRILENQANWKSHNFR